MLPYTRLEKSAIGGGCGRSRCLISLVQEAICEFEVQPLMISLIILERSLVVVLVFVLKPVPFFVVVEQEGQPLSLGERGAVLPSI